MQKVGLSRRRAAVAIATLVLAACTPRARFAALDLSGSTIAVAPANVTAGAAGQARVTVAAHAGSGAAIADPRLRITLQADGCMVTPAAAALGSDGRASFVVAACGAGAHALRARATIGALAQALAATSSLNAYVAAAHKADGDAAALSTAVTAGVPLSIAIDAGYAYTGTVQFVSSDPLATLPGPFTLDAARHGIAVLERQVVLRTPGTQTLAAVDAGTGQVLVTDTFEVVPAAAAALQLMVSTVAQARAGDALAVSVHVLDANGRAALARVGGVTLTSDDPRATLPAAQTAQAGLATFDGVVLRVAGTTTVTAQAAGGASGSTTVQVAPAAMHTLELTRADVLPAALWAVGDGTATPLRAAGDGADVLPAPLWAAGDGTDVPLVAGQCVPLLIAARDMYGNLASNLAGAVALQSSDPGAVLPPPLQFIAGTAAARAATVTLTTAGPQVLTAVAVNGMRATLPQVWVVAGPAARLQLTVPPGAVAGVEYNGITLAATDTFGNPASDYAGDTALAADDAAATLPASPSFVAGTPGPITLGAAVFSYPGTIRLRADTVPAGALAPASAPVTVASAAADPGHVTLSGGGTSVAADGVSAAALTLRVADAADYPVPGYAVQLSVDGDAMLTPQPAAGGNTVSTDAAGEVAIALRSVRARDAHLTAAVGPALVRLATVSFVAGAPSPENTVLLVSPNTQVADGVQAVALTLVAVDAQGNPVRGAPAELRSSSSGSNSNSGSSGDVLSPSVGVTDASGMLQATLQGTAAGTRVLTAVLPGAIAMQEVTLVPGPPAAGYTTLTASPQVQAADGQQVSTLTLMVADAQGNAAAAQPVWLTVSGSGNGVGAASGRTDARGLFVTTLQSTLPETKHITAAVGALTLNTTVTFVSGPPTIAHSSLAASPTALAADGVATSTLTLTARDVGGLPASGQPVTVLPPAAGVTVVPAAGNTDAQGIFTASASSTRIGAATVVVALSSGQLATTVQWQAGAPVASASHFTLTPPSQVADGASYALATLQLADRFGNPVQNVAVALTSSGSGNVVQPFAPTTDAEGRLQASVQSTVAEAKVVTAQVPAVAAGPGFALRAGAQFVAGLAAASQTRVTAFPGSTTADGVAALALTLQAADAQGNPVTAAPVSWAVSGSGTTLTPAAAVTDAAGRATASVTASSVGTRTVWAQLPGAAAAVDVSFSAGNANGTASTLVLSPDVVVADNAASTQIVATALDASAQPLANVYVSVAVSGSGNTLAAADGFTGPAGRFVTTLRASHAETKTVSVNIGGATHAATVNFVPGGAVAASSQLSLSPALAPADGSSTVDAVLRLADAQGNPTPGVAVSLATSGSGNSVAPVAGVTAADGTFAAAIAATVAEAKIVTATFAGQQLSASTQFVAGAPDAAQSWLALAGSPAAVDGPAPLGVTVHLGDAQGNAVVGAAVLLASSGTGNTFTILYPVGGSTDFAGNLQATLRSTVAEAKAITATAGSLVLTANGTFVAGAAGSATSALAATPGTLAADGAATATLTAVVRDARGNPVAGEAVGFATSGSGNVLSASTAVTDANGQASVTLASTRAETKWVTATFASTSIGTSVSFLPTGVAALTSSLTASPTVVVADNVAVSSLTLRALDARGNPVANQAVTLSSTGVGNVLDPNAGVTDAAGTFTAALRATVAENKRIVATVAGVSLDANVSFVAGTPMASTSTLALAPGTVVADGSSTATATVILRDLAGNGAAGVPVTFAATGGTTSFAPASGTTAADGSIASTLTSTQPQLTMVTARFAGTALGAPLRFTAPVYAPGTPTLAAFPSTVVANGSDTTTLTATVTDVASGPIVGATVSFAASGSGNALSAPAAVTNASGVASVTLRATQAGTKTVTATSAGNTGSATVSFVPGPMAAATSSLAALPAAAVADGSAAVTLALRARDAQGNAVIAQPAQLTTTGTGNSLSAASGTTDGGGTFVATLTSTVAQATLASATVAGVTVSAPVTFTPGAPAATASTLGGSPTTVPADGSSTAALLLRVLDAQGNPVPNVAVSLVSSGGGATLTPNSGSTGTDGTLTATVAATVAEPKTVTASFGGTSRAITVTFVPTAAASGASALTASPTARVADGSATTTLTASVRDAQGNAVPGALVSFSSTGSGNTLSPTTATTSAIGQASATLSSTRAEPKVVTASFAGTSVSTGVTFTVGAVAAGTSSLGASPSSLSILAASTLAVKAMDAQQNPITGQTINLTASGTQTTLTPTTGLTDSTGLFTAILTSPIAEQKTITATLGSITLSTTATFTPAPPSASTSTLLATPPTLPADGTTSTTLTATLRDAQGNVVPGQPVIFASTGSGNTLSAPTAVTTAAGTATVTLASSVAGQKAVTATFAGTSITTSVTFTAGAAAAGTSAFTASPNVLVADGTTTITLVVAANDAQGNAIAGQPVTLTASGTGLTLDPNAGVTSSAGSFVSTLRGTVAQVAGLTANLGALTLNANATLTPGAAASATSTLSAAPPSVVADGSAAAAFTLRINDAQGNGVAGQAVTFTSTGSGNVLSPTSATTDASGAAGFSLRSTVAQGKAVTASFNNTSVSAPVSFVAGPAAAGASQLSVSPSTVPANGVATTTLTVRLADAQGNAAPGQTVSFSPSGSANALSASSASTAANGAASVTLASTKAETKTLTASFGTGTPTVPASFVADVPAAATTTLVAAPAAPTANGSAATTLTVTARDAQGNPVANQAVTLTSSGSGNVLSAASGTTSASGSFSATLTSTRAETKTLTAGVGGATATTTVAFAPGPVSASTSTLGCAPTSITADNVATGSITATLLDAYGNPVPAVNVTLAASGTGNALSAGTGSSSASGAIAATLRSTRAEAKTLTLTGGGVTLSAPALFIAGAPVSAGAQLTATPASLTADGVGNSTLVAAFADAQGNPVSGATVSVTASGTHNVWSPAASGVTNAAGVFATGLSSSYAGARAVVASAGAASASTTVSFVVPSCSTTLLLGELPQLAVPIVPTGVAAGDLDGDGNADLCVGSSSAGLAVAPGHGNGAFSPFTQYTSSSILAAGACLIYDINRDGKNDVLAATTGSGPSIAVLLNRGGGTLAAPVNYAAVQQPLTLAVGDLNGDSFPDVVGSGFTNAAGNRISAHLATSSGTLQAAQLTPITGAMPVDIALGDIDRDGKLDVVAADANSNNVWLLRGLGTGSFAAATALAVGCATQTVRAVDVNADAKLDVVAGCTATSTVSTFLGNGDGSFQTVRTTAAGGAVQSLRVGDVTGDGVVDLVTMAPSPTNAIWVGAGQNNGSFVAAPMPWATPDNGNVGAPRTLVLSNIDGDARLDLVAVHRGDSRASILLGGGSRSFSTPTPIPLSAGMGGLAGAARDFNGDGALDLVVSGTYGTLNAAFLAGDGNGSFAPAVALAGTAANLWGVAAGDLNGDGRQDLIYANRSSNGVSLALGNGDGTFAALSSVAGAGAPYLPVVGDLNGDGRLDIVAPYHDGANAMGVYIGRGDGTVNAVVNYASVANLTYAVLTDVNRDGSLDVVAATSDGFSGALSVYLGNGDGTLGTGASVMYPSGNLGLAAADFNLDGKIDVVVSNNATNTVALGLGNGDGTFGVATTIASNLDGAGFIDVADLNGDGRPDIAVGTYAASNPASYIYLIFGRGDGTFATPVTYAAAGTPRTPRIADFNGDGRPDIAVIGQGGYVTPLVSTGCVR